MSLLSVNNTVNVKLYYEIKEVSKDVRKVHIFDDEEAKKLLESSVEEDKKRVEVLNTQWHSLSWGDSNMITKDCVYFDHNQGMQDIDYFKYRDLRIKKCLKSWDLKDDKGNPVPCVPEVIEKLPVEVVFALVNKYDEIVNLDNDEQGK